MSNLTAAQADFDKKDKRLRLGIGVLITYVVILLSFVAVQTLITQNTIKDNQTANAKASEERFNRYTADNHKQHEVTQAYIKCIANALLVPVSERSPGAFDQCGIEAKDEVNGTGGSEGTSFLELPMNSSQSLAPQATTNRPSNPPEPIIQPPVATAPPDPDRPLLVLPLPLLHLRIGDILQVGN